MSPEIIDAVSVTLDGDPVRLKVCRRAADEITAVFGNYMEVFKRLAEFDMNAYVAVVAAGLGKKRADVADAVFKSGLPDLTAPLSDYIGLLTRGGRPETKDEGEKKPGEA